MKIILAGATGYIGQTLLNQCLAHPSVTSVLALTRREIDTKHPKLRTYIMSTTDWTTYCTPALQSELRGASACLWTIGIVPGKARDDDLTKKVSVEFPRAAAEAFSRGFEGDGGGKKEGGKFRFVFVSGSAAIRDQTAELWYWGGYRKLRGESENVLFRHEEAHPGTFETYIMRPGPVPSTFWSVRDTVAGFLGFINVEVLSRAMIKVALNGSHGGERTFYNAAMKELGRE
ncbi:putative nucleoside-diphosphate-sugar epimerase [Aspergillus stella-maris]|uniref:putative nucleoside-diphosphate-sugar epimerase n=1 Tax=Aspergillus stella-maris TaxID=1810926 RepID=UPI003CCD209A